MTRNILLCGCRDKHKEPVAVSYRIGLDRRGNPGPQSIVLWRCRRCTAVKAQVLTGTWTLDEIKGEPVSRAEMIDAEDAAQRMITDQLADQALEMVAERPDASPTVAETVKVDSFRITDPPLEPLAERILRIGRPADSYPYAVNTLADPGQQTFADRLPPGPVPSYYDIGQRLPQRIPGQHDLPRRIPGSGPQIPHGAKS